MIYKIKISEEAALDLDEAYQWYESQISQLGSEFIRVVDKKKFNFDSTKSFGLPYYL